MVIYFFLQGKIVAKGTYDELQKLGDSFTAILRETEASYKRRDSSTRSGEPGSPSDRSLGKRPPLEQQKSLLDDVVPEVEFKSPKQRPKTDIFEEESFDVNRKTKSLTTLDNEKSPETQRLLHDGDNNVFETKNALEPSLKGSVASLEKVK